jgi:hypothetical protein
MLPAEELSDYMARLSDEELISQLRNGDLTEYASKVAHSELERRGIDVEHVVSQPPDERQRDLSQANPHFKRLRPALRRVVRFPLRTLLGIESPWLVILAGGGVVYAIYKFVVFGLSWILLERPLPPFAAPLAYAGIATFVLAEVWLAISLWRCSRHIELAIMRLTVKLIAVLFFFPVIGGTRGMIQVVSQYLER